MLRRPKDVATDLGVSAPTLRLWSSLFAPHLSDHARKALPGGGPTAQRRYDETDIAVLTEVRSLLRQGLTFDEVSSQLDSRSRIRQEAAAKRQLPERPRRRVSTAPESPMPLALGADAEALSPTEQLGAKDQTIAALREALAAKEGALRALEDALAAKDKTIDALKDSLTFFNAYLQAIGDMRSSGQQQQPLQQPPQWDDAKLQDDGLAETDEDAARPRWRRLLGLQ